jgi:hypothetical protein
VKLWTADGKQQGKDMPLADVAMRVAVTSDAGRIISGDWTGEVRVWNAADGKQLGTLSANPPKLEELLAAAKEKLSAQQAEHDRLAKVAEASTDAATQAADAAKAAGDKAATDKEAVDRAAAAAVAAQAEFDRWAAEIEFAHSAEGSDAGK